MNSEITYVILNMIFFTAHQIVNLKETLVECVVCEIVDKLHIVHLSYQCNIDIHGYYFNNNNI